MAKVKVKVNPLYPAGSIGDAETGLTFTKDKWVEVNGTDWKRLKESKGRAWNGSISMPRFIAEGEDMEIDSVNQTTTFVDNTDDVSDEVVDIVSEDWYASEEE